MSSSDLTREWLYTVLRPYPARDRILSEVLEVLSQRRTLSVKTDAFTFDSGQTALLLLLHGTLPITYRGGTYQIPLNLWIPYSYPREAPMAYVVPTKEMGVRKGKEVEPGGRVREEVVEEWWRSWQEKGVEILLDQLTSIFSATPPVYARPSEPISSPAVAGPSSQQRQFDRPASQSEYANGTASGTLDSSQQPGPPPPPARPGYVPPNQQPDVLPRYQPAQSPSPRIPQSQSFSFTPPSQASTSYSHQHRAQSLRANPQSPPLPHRPPHIPPRQSSQPTPSPSRPSIPLRPFIPMPTQASPARDGPAQAMTPPHPNGLSGQYPPYPLPQAQAPQNASSSSHAPPAWSQPKGYQPPYPQQLESQYTQSQPVFGQTAQPQFQQMPPSNQAFVVPLGPAPALPRQPLPDLLSSPSISFSSLPDTSSAATSPPPIPPSKPPPPSLLHLHSILLPHLLASLPPIVHSLQTNRAHLVERHEDLASGEPAIRDEMARLEAVDKVCDSVGRRMTEVVARGEERVVELEGRGEVSVDEVVCGISIVHNQLIDLVAEDNSIEDTIYHMTRALDSERIDLDRYLKSIRSLAREQYMKRALIERILQGMGQNQVW